MNTQYMIEESLDKYTTPSGDVRVVSRITTDAREVLDSVSMFLGGCASGMDGSITVKIFDPLLILHLFTIEQHNGEVKFTGFDVTRAGD